MMQFHPFPPEPNPELAAYLERRLDCITTACEELLIRFIDADNSCFPADSGIHKDLLKCLVESLRTGEVAEFYLAAVVERLQNPDTSICSFQVEKSCLLEAVYKVISEEGEDSAVFTVLPLLHLEHLAVRIMERTGSVYEQIVKHGGRAFCQINPDGMVVYANPEMLNLVGCDRLFSQPFTSLFAEADRQFIKEALSPRFGRSPVMRVLNLKTGSGDDTIPVGSELTPLVISGHHLGGYAGMVDISGFMASMNQVLEQISLGVIKINTRHEVTYANPSLCEMAGVEGRIKGLSVYSLFPDTENKAKVQRKVLERFKEGKPDEYRVELTRLDNRRKVPVMIAATPERDPRGEIVGSMAIIRSMELEKAAERINNHIVARDGVEDLLRKVFAEIADVCAFDMATVVIYSKNLDHVRILFSYPERKTRFRWFPMPASMRKWAQNRKGDLVDDMEKFLSGPEWAEMRVLPDIKGFLRENLHSMIRFPVWDSKTGETPQLIASLSFFRLGKGAFGKEDRKRFKSLPLVKTIIAALHLVEVNKLTFRFNLIKKIFDACDNMKKVADIITSELVRFYKWNNVSIFRINERDETFHLLSQNALDDNEDYLLPPGYTQKFGEGMLGYVRQSGKPVFSGNVREDPNVRQYFVSEYKGKSNSELCMPIMADGKPFWLLNIEDPMINAFSSDEVADLQMMHGEIGTILERAFKHHFLLETLENASDAIIVTDSNRNIRSANPAIKKLLGYRETELKEVALEVLFGDRKVMQWLQSGGEIPGREIVMRHKNGNEVSVFLSASELPEEIGGIVLIARDLSLVKRLEELDYLGRLYYEIAIQTKTPLSLLFSWLKRLKRETSQEDTLSKALKQLRKLTLTYDRLVLYDKKQGLVPYQPILFGIDEMLELLSDEFPNTEWQKVTVDKPEDLPLLRGDIFQLKFCVETILSYLLRTASEEGRVNINIGCSGGRIVIVLSGTVPQMPDKASALGTSASVQLSETIVDMALGDKVISNFIANHNGEYSSRREDDELEFTIELNAAPERSEL